MKKVRVVVYYSGYVGNQGNGLEDALLHDLKLGDHEDLKTELEKLCNIEFIDPNFNYDGENYNSHTWSDEHLSYFKTPFFDLFIKEIYLDFRFGKELKLFDFINTSAFRSDSVIGNLFIKLLNNSQWIFIVNQRFWVNENKLHLELLMGERGYERQMMERFLGTYKFDK
jgi:hypothetical protein